MTELLNLHYIELLQQEQLCLINLFGCVKIKTFLTVPVEVYFHAKSGQKDDDDDVFITFES